jgi:hypothetical protein
VFDASSSTGDGLSYRIEFGDGQQTTSATASHVAEAGEHTARLTVTDREGRTAITEQKYFAAKVENRSGTFWFVSLDGVRALELYLRVDGANVTGWLEMSRDNLRNVPIVGSLSGERNLTLRSNDGAIEMSGSLTWSDPADINFSQARVRIRLSVRGGPADGATVLMSYADPF